MEESRPVPLEVLGEGLQVHDWRGYLYECTSATIKEGREKSRGWISASSLDPNVEIAFKKVGDGHPLRLWKFTTELDAPPAQVLQYVFKERHQWDQHLLKWRIIEQLDERSEIFQYATGGQTITDYCVLRFANWFSCSVFRILNFLNWNYILDHGVRIYHAVLALSLKHPWIMYLLVYFWVELEAWY